MNAGQPSYVGQAGLHKCAKMPKNSGWNDLLLELDHVYGTPPREQS